MSHAGRFVWRELVAPAPTDGAKFYAQLFGWSTKPVEMGLPEPYTMLHHDGLAEDVGGATAPPMDGVPPHWLNYISVDDVDASLARVVALGGTALTPATDIAVGRFALVQDPAGASFALFRGPDEEGSEGERPPPVGTFCWSQLMTDDIDRVAPFYAELFGWTPVVQKSGAVWFMAGDSPRASAMPQPGAAGAPNHWLQYVSVADTDAAFAQAKRLGARPLMTPTDIEGMGRFAVLSDPAGANFALWTDAQG